MHISGQGNTIYDLYEAMRNVLTDVGWVEHNIGSASIYEGVGGGSDKIYIYFSPQEVTSKIIIDSCVGYDLNLGAYEQPGCLRQWLKDTGKDTRANIPAFTIVDGERFYYWIFADTYRIIVVCRMSIQYESMYVGFTNPIASERQYPYPMYICGNTCYNDSVWPDNKSSSFVFPQGGTGWLRRADGVWRSFQATMPNPSPSTQGTVFPYNTHNQKLIPNYKETDSINQDNFLLIPIMLQMNDPVDNAGILRGCYWVSGTRDIDAERILTHGDSQYIVFDTKQERGANTYFAIKLE